MDDVSFNTLPCECVCYGVLVRISPGYPPPMGRLHTRYAPVRRSPAVHCCTPLPLDLHVLGLPLAFILSQDQTLHCKNFCSLPLTLRVPLRPPPEPASDTRYLLFQPFQWTVAPASQPLPGFSGESECKGTTIFQTTKIFFWLNQDKIPLNIVLRIFMIGKKIFFGKKNKKKHH